MHVCDNTSVKHRQQSQYQWLRAQHTLPPAKNKQKLGGGLEEARLVFGWDHSRERHLVDPACTIATVYSVVALLSPVFAPAVLDDPVRNRLATETSLVHAEADEQDSVVNVRRTAEELPRVRDAAKVKLHCIGIDSDRNGSMLHQPVGKLSLVLWQPHEALHSSLALGLVELARAVHALVRVLGLRLEASHLDDSLESLSHVAALAAIVSMVTVDELLFGEREQLVA